MDPTLSPMNDAHPGTPAAASKASPAKSAAPEQPDPLAPEPTRIRSRRLSRPGTPPTPGADTPKPAAPESQVTEVARPEGAAQALDALLTRRRQVLEMLMAERNRLEHAVPAVGRGITQHIRWLERQLHDVDRDLDDTIQTSPVWRAKDNRLRSTPGVGPILSRTARTSRISVE